MSRHQPSPAIGGLPAVLMVRLPFYYGWVILACACCAGFARQGPAVATLSVFVEPMTSEFGWSRTALSGAVSLGGILAAIAAPLLGPTMDRRGPKLILILAVVSTALTLLSLSLIHSLAMFYLLYCIARMNFAGPFDLGIYGAIYNWFVARRATATAIATFTQMIALAIMPLIAHAAILHGGWRLGWIAVGLSALVVGLVPTALLMVRRPEDAGLLADPHPRSESSIETPGAGPLAAVDEPSFTRAEALATPAFWMLALFTLLIYPVQAGVSLHQAPHLIERGLDSTAAALIVAIFSLASAFSGLAFGPLIRRAGIRWALALVAVILGASSAMMIWVREPQFATLTAALYGVGIGGLLTGLPLAWVETFGRRSFGAIRGAALSIQVAAQAAGPLISGALRDWTGDYVLSLWTFAVMAALALASALLIRPATR